MIRKQRIKEVYQLLLNEFETSCNIEFCLNSVWLKKKNSPNALPIVIHYENSGAPDSNSSNGEIVEFVKQKLTRNEHK